MLIQAKCNREVYQVAEPCTVEIVLKLDQSLSPQDCIQFQFPNSWSLRTGPSYTREFQHFDPGGAHFISISVADCAPAEFELSIHKRHLYYPKGAVRHGRLITARLAKGTVPAGTAIHFTYANTFAPYVSETENVWIRVNGEVPETLPVLKVEGGAHDHFRIITPSSAFPGDRFDVLLVSLDCFDNASSAVFADENLILSDGSVIAEHFRLSGSLRVPVRIDKPGVYRFRFRDTLSNAIKVSQAMRGPYWGDIHIHTKLSHDGQGTDPYTYAREVSGLDFAGVADHWESLGPEGYLILTQWAEDANTPGSFVSLLADERNPEELTGHHNAYFRDLGIMNCYKAIKAEDDDVFANSLSKLQNTSPSEVMLIPHHTGISFGDLPQSGIGCAVNWDAVDDKGLRPVMEIYSHHGQSELYNPTHLLAYEWNRMRNPERRANTSVPGPFYAQDYWRAGKRIGVIASSDEHSGQGGRRHGGISAVFADSLTRKGIFDALRCRRCYATTGERILVEFTIDGLEMGSSGQRKRGTPVTIMLNVWGTDTLLRVEILRYRFGMDISFVPVVSTFPRPENTDAMVSYDDLVETSCMYYARVIQEPLAWPAMAWTSPIWIDVKEPER